jgi:hypothetical protein
MRRLLLLLKGGFDGSRGGSWREAWMEEEVVADWLIKKLLLNGGVDRRRRGCCWRGL